MITANFKNGLCNNSICSLDYIKAKVKKKKKNCHNKISFVTDESIFFMCILIGKCKSYVPQWLSC